MENVKLNRAVEEAEKFIDTANRYLDSAKTINVTIGTEKSYTYNVYNKKLSGSLKRQSMELSNALIAYRNPK